MSSGRSSHTPRAAQKWQHTGERIHEHAPRPPAGHRRRGWLPVVDRRTACGSRSTTDAYTEDDKALIVEAHLPNFDEKDITVNVDGGVLVIQAERHEQEEDKKKQYVVRESSSSFYRSIALPEQAEEAKISAAFTKGVLKVTVPLAEATSPRQITIGTAAG